MLVEIITPDAKLFDGEVSSIHLPGTNGRFEILNDHAPIISILNKGTIKVTDINKKEQFVDILGGSIEMFNNKITILAETE